MNSAGSREGVDAAAAARSVRSDQLVHPLKGKTQKLRRITVGKVAVPHEPSSRLLRRGANPCLDFPQLTPRCLVKLKRLGHASRESNIDVQIEAVLRTVEDQTQ